ncbi:putative B3 domain-containing protein At1g05615 [Alnus glutinosa]|uniref:putative B3 domain-containing protein At1g05615 n=1 Tax=Alnus glutinosa TaxID=3517 RepID=UPI002D76CF9F|nr:putative B3 domain-containing protein At1g05615 [Alnus glutinosa]
MKNMTKITLDNLKSSPALCGDFNKMREEAIREVGDNPNEVDRRLTEMILPNLIMRLHVEKKNQEKKEEDSCNRKKPLDQNPEIVEEEKEKSREDKRKRKNPIEIKQMPTNFEYKIKGMQGSDIKLVIQKELTITDMEGSQDRLSIPSGQMMHEFLSKEEQVMLKEKEADGIHFKGMEVPLIEPDLQESTIFLKKWKLGKNNCYMLSKPWIKVAKRNKLESSNTIQLWSFRGNQSLHLALIKLDN